MEWVRRTHVIRSPTPGGRGSPPLRFLPAFFDVHPLRLPLGLDERLARLVRPARLQGLERVGHAVEFASLLPGAAKGVAPASGIW